MASKRQAGPGAAVPAQEQKIGDAARLVRRPMPTVPKPMVARSLRALADVSNLINDRPALANRQKQVVVAAENCRKAVPQVAARSRRALADVGNLINGRPAPANRQKPLVAASDRNGKAVKLKELSKVKPEVIVISSDSEKEKKAKVSGGQRIARRVPTLTDILTTCSRASDGVISSPKKVQAYDIDAPDAHNELAVVEYVEDIYRFYKSTEGTCLPLSSYMSSQAEISERMRAILVDWIIEVQHRLALMPETLYLTVYIIDRYLSMESVPRKELQLVGVSAMLIACKYEEIWAPLVKDLLCLCDNAFTREQVLTKEKAILDKLHWNLTVPTMYMFIVRYLKAAMGDKEFENMAFFYSELALVQYTMLVYPPSVIAATAVYAARSTLEINPRWTDILEYHTGLTEPQLLDCARRLISFHALAPESKQKAVYRKYSNPKLGAVSLYSPSKKLLSV
ncbi:Cyclin-B1-3 [Dichanthelium oligosanthes]|uniref:Cyclin-B1-3 n=1 Tax=Dichanthelium oligosanthes TaxID=888268 RepID=A0A1E5VML2_9POAL|nr:Cyclin-B1-3 [Dichanthelium oligosanthes]